MNSNNVPIEVNLHKKSAILELVYADNSSYQLGAEFLRVYSPSAEVRGHGQGQETLQTGKKLVKILAIEVVGNYAVRLIFDDKHDSGIYSWDYLYDLSTNQDKLWHQYLERLQKAHASRESLPSGVQVVNIMPLSSKTKPANQAD